MVSAPRCEDYSLLFDSVPDPCLVLDPEFTIVAVNRAYLEATMTRPEDIVGQGIFEVFPDNPGEPDATGVRNLRISLERVRKTRVQDIMAVQKYDIRTAHPEGGRFEVRYWSPINTPVLRDGELIHIIHRVQDVTEYVLAQQDKAALTAEMTELGVKMEAEAYNRTKEIAEINLRLKQANDELEAFNYTAAHDLRQPLNVIYGYCQAIEMLCGNQLNADCRGYLHDSYQGIERMTRLLDALLDFSRMNRVEPRRARVDLSATAEGVAKELKDTDPQRAVAFRIAEGIEVDADPALIAIVLQNLLGNAWKYTAKQENAVIEFGAIEVDGNPAYFVRDNGPGFDMTDADKLFAPFQRLPAAQSSPGFGIGLATVQRIVGRHGGRVWAEGVPGKGATFYFTLTDK